MLTDKFNAVYALFKAQVNIVDHAKKNAIARELLLELAPEKAKSQSFMRDALVDLMDEDENDREFASCWDSKHTASTDAITLYSARSKL